MLKDGSDSVGALGALNRVYLNIGLFSEEWLLHFNPVIGGKPITPIEIASAREELQLLAGDRGLDAAHGVVLPEGGEARPAEGCAGRREIPDRRMRRCWIAARRCSPRPARAAIPARRRSLPRPGSVRAAPGPGYLQCWNNYWAWTKTDDYKKQMRAIVSAPDFLDGNYLSTEARVPVTLLQTNACSPLATNALAGNIWDNFSSQSYKTLPSVGTITVHDPFTGKPSPYKMPAGGRGYTRPPSLISLWSTAPFLLNNTVGETRSSRTRRSMRGCGCSRRRSSRCCGPRSASTIRCSATKCPGSDLPHRPHDRAQQRHHAGGAMCRNRCGRCQRRLNRLLPSLFGADGGITIGPFPKGLPVNLLANLQPLSESDDPLERVRHCRATGASCWSTSSSISLTLPADATDEQMVSGIARPRWDRHCWR